MLQAVPGSGRAVDVHFEVAGDSIGALVRNYVHLIPGSTCNPVRTATEVIRNRDDHRRTMEAR